jgi:hypothetical protein
MLRTIRTTLLLFVVACSLIACGKRELSRAEAATAITTATTFPTAEGAEILNSCQKSDYDGHLFQYSYGADNNSLPVPDISYFVANGLLTITPAGHPGNVFSDVALGFTEATKAYQMPSSKYRLGIKLCDRVFGEITGIQTNEQSGTAVVEYSLRRSNWTPFGEYYRKANPNAYPEVIPSRATFTRYDDGWRITGQ